MHAGSELEGSNPYEDEEERLYQEGLREQAWLLLQGLLRRQNAERSLRLDELLHDNLDAVLSYARCDSIVARG